MAVTVDSFVGRYQIPQPFNGDVTLQEYIDHYSNYYFNNLFGAELYQEYLTGIGTSDPIYTKLRDPFAEDIQLYDDIDERFCNQVLISEGVDKMLICLIYAHYQREDLPTPTAGGNITINPSGGELENDDRTNVFNIYNQGINTYQAIQQYIVENRTDYPNFKGEYRGKTWLI